MVHVRVAIVRDLDVVIALVNVEFTVETFLEGQRTDGIDMAQMAATGHVLVAEDAHCQVVGAVYTELRDGGGYFAARLKNPTGGSELPRE